MFLQDELKQRTENLAIESWYQDERITNRILDLVHHLFWLDEDRGWAEAVPRFVEAWLYDYRWAKSLLEVIDDFSGQLCSLGKKRLEIFQAEFEAGSSAKETEAIFDELEKISRQTKWLANEGKEEREIILLRESGWVKYSQSKYEEALEIFVEVEKKLSTNCIALRTQLGSNFYNVALGLGLQEKPNYELAIASYDKALEIKPDKHEAWNNRGIALNELGRNEEAIASFDKALEIKPDYANAYYNKACLFALQNKIETALELLTTAINLDPKYQEMAKTDSDFDSIREDPRFQALTQDKQL
ncbi:MAG: tetratricopeptide repeat protein [Limnothrix sp. RL_2_0]|nr:tetratricopeptide repeat protein [Limnothrix sp. RL_2_0]